MNIVIPMAGVGSRFSQAGYAAPKALLTAHGKTLLEWSVDSLPLDLADRVIFVGLDEHRLDFDLEKRIRTIYGGHDPGFLWLEETTRGQAETVWFTRDLLDPDAPLLIFNIDTAFRSETLRELLVDGENDGILGAFLSDEPRFSFASVGPPGTVDEVREKQPISRNALTGLYHFRRTREFLEVAGDAIARNEMEKGEFYVAPLYNKLISRGRRFRLDTCSEHWILGTPEEYEHFLRHPPSLP